MMSEADAEAKEEGGAETEKSEEQDKEKKIHGLAEIRFYGERLTLPAEDRRMIPVRRPAKETNEEAEAEVKSSDPAVARIIRQPAFLKGHEIGQVRVETGKPGKTILRAGKARLELEVTSERGYYAQFSEAPRIVGPAAGVFVYEEFSVGMEFFDPGIGAKEGDEVQMRLQVNGSDELIEPVETLGPVNGPELRARFEVVPAKLKLAEDGRIELTPIGLRSGKKMVGETVTVFALPGDAEIILAGEAEEHSEADEEKRKGSRFSNRAPGVGFHPKASAGRYVLLPQGNPSLMMPMPIQEPGFYQVMLRVQGNLAGGAYSALYVHKGKRDNKVSSAQTLGYDWHWITAGGGIYFNPRDFEDKEGNKVQPYLTVQMANDFGFRESANRDLAVDAFKVVRVPEGLRATIQTKGYAETGLAWYDQDWDRRSVRVAFENPLEGRKVSGRTEISGSVWRRNQNGNVDQKLHRRARTELLLNGEVAGSDLRDRFTFNIPAWKFREGGNEVQLRSTLFTGEVALSQRQTIYTSSEWEKVAEPKSGTPVRNRFAAGAELPEGFAWHANTDLRDIEVKGVTKLSQASGHDKNETGGEKKDAQSTEKDSETAKTHRKAYGLYSHENEVNLSMPHNVAGIATIWIEGQAEVFRGNPKAAIYLVGGGANQLVGEIELGENWQKKKVGEIELSGGEQSLQVRLINDMADGKKGDRNVYVGAIELKYQLVEDEQAPVAKILYPKEGQQVASTVDALVIEASDNRALTTLQIEVDGQKLPYQIGVAGKTGPFFEPLLLRGIERGQRDISVIAVDAAGNFQKSQPVRVWLRDEAKLSHADRVKMPYHRAVHLSKRFGYGADPRALGEILVHGEKVWLREQVDRPWDHPAELAAMERTIIENGSPNDYERINMAIYQGILSPNPVRTRFAFWAQNHFSTWINKSGAGEKWREHQRFAQAGVVSFFDLLYTSATSPAMLIYLDQHRSFESRLNENYAREIMELHSLGVHGGYTQEDVTALAGLLTGWFATQEILPGQTRGNVAYNFRYDPFLNTQEGRDIFGLRLEEADPEARYDRVRQFIEMLAAHPSTAKHIAEKIAWHYVAKPAPKDLVETLTQTFIKSGGDMGEMLLAVADHPAFWAEENMNRLMQPLDFGLSKMRATTGRLYSQSRALMNRTGREIFGSMTPDGYPEEDDEYADSNYLLQKWRYAKEIEWVYLRRVPWDVRSPEAIKTEEGRQQLVDYLAAVITGKLLSETSNDAVLQILENEYEGPNHPGLQVGTLIAQLPESQIH